MKYLHERHFTIFSLVALLSIVGCGAAPTSSLQQELEPTQHWVEIKAVIELPAELAPQHEAIEQPEIDSDSILVNESGSNTECENANETAELVGCVLDSHAEVASPSLNHEVPDDAGLGPRRGTLMKSMNAQSNFPGNRTCFLPAGRYDLLSAPVQTVGDGVTSYRIQLAEKPENCFDRSGFIDVNHVVKTSQPDAIWLRPVVALSITPGRRFQSKHKGLDYGCGRSGGGQPILAVRNGITKFMSFNKGGYGNLAQVFHQDVGLRSRYAHLKRFRVGSNVPVAGGVQIGDCGSTGRSPAGEHLHFELAKGNTDFYSQIDPSSISRVFY